MSSRFDAAGADRRWQGRWDEARAFEADSALTSAFGDELATTLVDVRRGELDRLGALPPAELCAVMRYLH